MTTALTSRRRNRCAALVWASLLAATLSAHAQTYRTGSIITNDLVFTNRRAYTNDQGQVFAPGTPLRLSDLAGRIVFLEFYAVW